MHLQYVTLTEDMTTSSSRIFLKTLFQDLSEIMGLIALNKRLQDPSLAQFFDGIFPKVSRLWQPSRMTHCGIFSKLCGMLGTHPISTRHPCAAPHLITGS